MFYPIDGHEMEEKNTIQSVRPINSLVTHILQNIFLFHLTEE